MSVSTNTTKQNTSHSFHPFLHNPTILLPSLLSPTTSSSSDHFSDQNSNTFELVMTTSGVSKHGLQDCWPEPIIRVQSISETGSTIIPDKYIKPPSQRPCSSSIQKIQIINSSNSITLEDDDDNLPIIDLNNLLIGDEKLSTQTQTHILKACKEWGFFQVINHGVNIDLLRRTREVWREFFHLPIQVKQEYANTPRTYEGYGSRLGVQKDAILDWSDYFFLHFLPPSLKDHQKWPILPSSCRGVTDEYGKDIVKLCKRLMKVLSVNLGLEEEFLENAFGGNEGVGLGASLRVNFYPKCPQPDLTLGLSPHSDPGCMTLLLPDDHVAGLQVFKADKWVTIQPVLDSIIVNIGDQIQVLSNGIYKSVEHRVIVNSAKERISLAFFCNPNSKLLIEPAKELVTPEKPALYLPMTFDEYRLHIRTRGITGKSQVESLKSR